MDAVQQQTERITVEDVEVGDKIAKSRNAVFHTVEQIDECPTTRRLHLAREACSEPEPKEAQDGRTYCPGCNRWYLVDSTLGIARSGHGQMGGGNIRPRRSLKLWRVV